MKYIKLFEVYDMWFLTKYKKYILLTFHSNIFIVENLGDQLKKLYSNELGEFKPYDETFYFTLQIEKFEKVFAYDSDDIDDILTNMDLILNTKKYNV